VDIIGRDIYSQTAAANNHAQFESISLKYPNKLVTLSENGDVAKISEQWTKGARWSFFMPWYDNSKTTLAGHEHADTQWWLDAVGQSYVITRDKMPSLK
jgi:mannan endo-1,4-beta-mannosidase